MAQALYIVLGMQRALTAPSSSLGSISMHIDSSELMWASVVRVSLRGE